MRLPRRSFLGTAMGSAILSKIARGGAADERLPVSPERLDEVAAAPVLRVEGLEKPVVIALRELLRNRRNFLVRVRTTDGAEGIAVPNGMHMVHTYPIFLNRVVPFFQGKDARRLEPLLWELYRHDDNYKYQGLALWVCVAAAEFSVLADRASGRIKVFEPFSRSSGSTGLVVDSSPRRCYRDGRRA